ncbi:MAG TPA: hypothetical protein VJR89_01140 [Polyangiales bacterium]|nr:hypothetical protein [Polyangiales bacterium]
MVRLGRTLLFALGVASFTTQLAAAAPKQAELVIEAPESMLLGRDLETELRIRAPKDLRFQLYVNVGEVSEPVEMEPGVYRARYAAPQQRFPQVALLVAVAQDSDEFALARIELHGTASVLIESEPQAQLHVRVGSAQFGPVTADRSGHARLDIVVPPGVRDAVSVATDDLGNQKERALPLGIPAFSRLFAVCPRRDPSLLLFALDAKGRPAEEAAFETRGTRAEAGRVVQLGPGAYRMPLEIPEGVLSGELAEISVGLRGASGPRVECRLEVPRQTPEAVAIELSATSLSAASAAPIDVRVVLKYAGSRERSPTPIQLSTDFGKLAATRGESTSVFETRWTVPAGFEGRSSAKLSVRAGKLSTQAQLALVPGPVAALRAELSGDDLLADGRSRATLRVLTLDAHDNRVDGVQLAASSRGKLSEFRRLEAGHYACDYVAPLSHHNADDAIALQVPGSAAATHVRVALRGLRTPLVLGARGGYASNFAKVGGPLAAVFAAYRPAFAGQRILLGVDLGFQHSSNAESSLDEEAIALRVDALPLLARVGYVLPVGDLELSLLAGAGVVLAKTSIESESTGSVSEASTSFAWSGAARCALPIGPGAALVELGYLHSAAAGEVVSGNLGGAQVTLGYAVDVAP